MRSNSNTILLRKIGGVFDACRRSAFGALHGTRRVTHPSISGMAYSLAAFLLVPLMLLAILAAALAFHPTVAVAAVPVKFSPLVGLAFAGEIENVSNSAVEKRERLAKKQDELAEVMTLAKDGGTYDLSRKTVLEKLGAASADDAIAKIKQRNMELDALGLDVRNDELKFVENSISRRNEERQQPTSLVRHPGTDGKLKSFGEMFVATKAYTDGWLKNHQRDIPATIEISVKTIMETGAGFAPESVRSGLLVEHTTAPISVLDLIPVRPINQAVDKYMEETTRTDTSAETLEKGLYNENTYVWTEKTSPVQKITNSVPVTDEQLEDAPQVSAILDTRLRFGLRQRLDLQVLVGDGVNPNLEGILHRAIQSQAKGADPTFDAAYKALTLVRFTGRAFPNAFVFHPNDFQDIRLTRTSTGDYIFGNPSTAGATTLFGLPVAISTGETENTGLVGDFANFCYIAERRGVEVQVGYIDDQFTHGMKTLRGDLRVAFTVTRLSAFAKITGI